MSQVLNPPEATKAQKTFRKKLQKLNMQVTEAIMEAEKLEKDAGRAWGRVALAEQAIVDSGVGEGIEMDIARRGVKSAQKRALKFGFRFSHLK